MRRVDQPRDLDHRGRGTDVAEDLAVGAPDLLPVADVDDVHARADDVFQARPRLLERRGDVPERLHGLGVRIALADDLSVRSGRGGARDVDDVADADGARVADDRLPRARRTRCSPASRHASAPPCADRRRGTGPGRPASGSRSGSRRSASLSGARSGLPSASGKAKVMASSVPGRISMRLPRVPLGVVAQDVGAVDERRDLAAREAPRPLARRSSRRSSARSPRARRKLRGRRALDRCRRRRCAGSPAPGPGRTRRPPAWP